MGGGLVGLTVVVSGPLLSLGYVVLLVEHAPLEDATGVTAVGVDRVDGKVRPLNAIDDRNGQSFPEKN